MVNKSMWSARSVVADVPPFVPSLRETLRIVPLTIARRMIDLLSAIQALLTHFLGLISSFFIAVFVSLQSLNRTLC
jgi:hypothetical protein